MTLIRLDCILMQPLPMKLWLSKEELYLINTLNVFLKSRELRCVTIGITLFFPPLSPFPNRLNCMTNSEPHHRLSQLLVDRQLVL